MQNLIVNLVKQTIYKFSSNPPEQIKQIIKVPDIQLYWVKTKIAISNKLELINLSFSLKRCYK